MLESGPSASSPPARDGRAVGSRLGDVGIGTFGGVTISPRWTNGGLEAWGCWNRDLRRAHRQPAMDERWARALGGKPLNPSEVLHPRGRAHSSPEVLVVASEEMGCQIREEGVLHHGHRWHRFRQTMPSRPHAREPCTEADCDGFGQDGVRPQDFCTGIRVHGALPPLMPSSEPACIPVPEMVMPCPSDLDCC